MTRFPVDYARFACEWTQLMLQHQYQRFCESITPEEQDRHSKEIRKMAAELSTRAAEWHTLLERSGWIPEQGTVSAGEDALSLPDDSAQFRVIQADEEVLREMIFAESRNDK